jgi:hypothetical protein
LPQPARRAFAARHFDRDLYIDRTQIYPYFPHYQRVAFFELGC